MWAERRQPSWRNKWQAMARHWWRTTKAVSKRITTHPAPPPPPLSSAGLEKAGGRKDNDDCVLFELCVLWSILAWLFMSLRYAGGGRLESFHHCISNCMYLENICGGFFEWFFHLKSENLGVISTTALLFEAQIKKNKYDSHLLAALDSCQIAKKNFITLNSWKASKAKIALKSKCMELAPNVEHIFAGWLPSLKNK